MRAEQIQENTEQLGIWIRLSSVGQSIGSGNRSVRAISQFSQSILVQLIAPVNLPIMKRLNGCTPFD